jgi:hypothetical protein
LNIADVLDDRQAIGQPELVAPRRSPGCACRRIGSTHAKVRAARIAWAVLRQLMVTTPLVPQFISGSLLRRKALLSNARDVVAVGYFVADPELAF